MKTHMVIFGPSGRRGPVAEGQTLLEAARGLGVGIESVCGGLQVCGKCRIRVELPGYGRGSASLPGPLSPFSEEEARFITPRERDEGFRLACNARVHGDLTVFVPEESRAVRQVVRKEATPRYIKLRPAVGLFPLTLTEPTLADPAADDDRLTDALSRQHGIEKPEIDLTALRRLPGALRRAEGSVTAVLWMERVLLDLLPGPVSRVYGLAVDIGSTTVAGYLCNLANGDLVATHSLMNPQVAVGEDVMSRIAYVMDHPEDGLERLRSVIVAAINQLTREVCEQAGLCPDDLFELTLVGNTAMHHFVLGIDPRPLGVSPFVPAVARPLDIKARDLGLAAHPAANVHILPIEAGFVGADNVGVLIAETPYQSKETVLIIDVGTNGEMVLGNRDRLLSCSCATGPALEGAHVRFGMRAAEGAIERIRIDPATLEASFSVIGSDGWSSETKLSAARGICGSGIIDGVAELHRTGVIDNSGRFRRDLETKRLRLNDGKPEFVIAWRDETALGEEITIGQQDIRSVQLAKAALYAGAKLMMKRLEIARPDRVVLAGAFGSRIDKLSALRLGIYPDCDLQSVSSVGNAAGDGARLALLDREKRIEAETVARRVEYLELSGEKAFQEEFLAALAIPHERDPFPHLPPAR